jgi:hypothetical protein
MAYYKNSITEIYILLAFSLLQGASKTVLQWYSKCYCVASVTKTSVLKGIQTIHRYV